MLVNEMAQLCRLCLKSGDWPINIFDPKGTDGFLVWSIMKELVEIQSCRGDGFPSRICGSCMGKLVEFKEFKKVCINSRIKLLKIQMNVGLIEPRTAEEPSSVRGVGELVSVAAQLTVKQEPVDDDVVLISDEETDSFRDAVSPGGTMKSVKQEFHLKSEDCKEDVLSGMEEIKEEEEDSEDEHSGDDLDYAETSSRESESENVSRLNGDNSEEEGDGRPDNGSEGRDLNPTQRNNSRQTSDVPTAKTSQTKALQSRPQPGAGSAGNALLPSGKVSVKRKRDKTGVRDEGSREKEDGKKMVESGRSSNKKLKELRLPRIEHEKSPEQEEEEETRKGDGKKMAGDSGSSSKEKHEEATKEGSFPCSECGFKLPSRKELMVHITASHSSVVCDHCKKVFKRKHHLANHIKWFHLSVRNVACADCDRKFSSVRGLMLHARKVHVGPESWDASKEFACSCEHCGLRFVTMRSMIHHVKSFHEGLKSFSCDQCSRKFTRKETLSSHVKSMHSDGERKFQCDVCNRRFKRMEHLKGHVAIHEDHREFKCHHCGMEFNTRNALRLHSKKHSGVVFSCPICSKGFKLQSELNCHNLIHEERKFQCELCPKAFATRSNLKVHGAVHTGERRHKCELCNKRYSCLGNLLGHKKKKHGGERPFRCEVCPKSFQDKGTLQRHMVIHSGLKPFVCEVCDKAFNLMSNLKRHMATHADTS